MKYEVIIKTEKLCPHCDEFLNVNVYPHENDIKIELRCENQYCAFSGVQFIKEIPHNAFKYVGYDATYLKDNHLNIYSNEEKFEWECKLCSSKFRDYKKAKKHFCEALVCASNFNK